MKDKRRIIIISLAIITLLLLAPFPHLFAMEEPEYLIFKGESDSWEVVVEVRQSKRNIYQYEVSERHELTYKGEPIEGKSRNHPVEWRIDSVLSSSESSNMASEFSEILGTTNGGVTIYTNASHQVADVDDAFRVDIVWNGSMNEQMSLTCVAWE